MAVLVNMNPTMHSSQSPLSIETCCSALQLVTMNSRITAPAMYVIGAKPTNHI